ncbi:lipid asymmetry maintenance protein MlaB [Thalassotalea maritima]|uniref:STAS domain-containing protein n=1 Tax=Thalassotalea maritima TaxID=3242416 RepID=UPI0035281D14
MNNQFTLAATDASIQVIGDLTRKTIIGKQQKVFADIVNGQHQAVDLSQLKNVDTAGLAWLLMLFQYAKQKQSTINYSQAPVELVKLAKLSRVDQLLNID